MAKRMRAEESVQEKFFSAEFRRDPEGNYYLKCRNCNYDFNDTIPEYRLPQHLNEAEKLRELRLNRRLLSLHEQKMCGGRPQLQQQQQQ